ncbi:hypothetical protein P3S68_016163 [Capsicum galapagoense]
MGRHLIEEHRLVLTKADGKQIRPVLASIEPRRWIKFAQNPGPLVSIIIREFYTNRDVTTNTSTVRGHTIFFAPRVINMLYETPGLDDTHLIEWHVDTHGRRDWFLARNLSLVAKDLCILVITITQLINILGNLPYSNFGFVTPTNIGIPTLHALGPCVGPNKRAGRRLPVRGEFVAYVERLEEQLKNIYNQQQQLRDKLAVLRTIQTEHLVHIITILQNFGNMINTMVSVLQLANALAIPPFTFQDMDFNFPAGHVNFQPPLYEDHTSHGGTVAENAPHPGIQQNYEFVPRVFDPKYADIDIALEELIGMSKASVGSGNIARSSTNKE